ncbi:unnamed protein product [Cylicocyclus nassatus]|uniref:MSP domain-containing protein n=1 Tax=Cylicocyclus nassatus TaxID=53992 RepID=A0AA36H7Z0_CYLNA|nr:unnamed protein product [Cylicocyclus nassatus]
MEGVPRIERTKKDHSKEANPGSIRGTLSPRAAMPRVTGGADASSTAAIIETYQELLKSRVIGETPNGEILCYPRWLIFNSPNGYKKPCYGDFTITNKDPFTVAWCIKAKEKMMRLSQSHGILKAGEHIDLTLYLISSDDWPRDVIEYTGRRLKIVVENLRIPETIRPKNKLESSRMSKDIFHYSSSQSPLLRMYTKISILLE